jgi:hypothetical protein
VSRCAKRVLNGPCGGSTNGKCEISKDVDCAWQLIVARLESLGRWMNTRNWPCQGLVNRPGRRPPQGGERGGAAMSTVTPSKLEKCSKRDIMAVTSECGPPRGSDLG